jgi:hypothetical protein
VNLAHQETKTASATCPSGGLAIGGGYAYALVSPSGTFDDFGGPLIHTIDTALTGSPPSTWQVTGYNALPGTTISLTATVYCVP